MSSSSPTSPDNSEKLTRFPQEVRDAYSRYLTAGDLDAAQFVVLAIVRDHLPQKSDAPITDTQRLIEDLGYDSLAVAEVVFAIEDVFNLRIETSEIMTISTVGNLKDFIALKIGKPN